MIAAIKVLRIIQSIVGSASNCSRFPEIFGQSDIRVQLDYIRVSSCTTIATIYTLFQCQRNDATTSARSGGDEDYFHGNLCTVVVTRAHFVWEIRPVTYSEIYLRAIIAAVIACMRACMNEEASKQPRL